VLAHLGGQLMVQALELAQHGHLQPRPQTAEGVCYAHKIEKHEAAIDWSQDALAISRRVRAFNPFPGASAVLAGETLKVWGAEPRPAPADHVAPPGQILAVTADGIDVQAGQSVLTLTELQRPGGKRLRVADFARGFELRPGMAFEQGAA
jgi:methionyl-tRNA formyltransferase